MNTLSVNAPDLVKIAQCAKAEVLADYADLNVTIRGSSLFTGDAALEKAKEVAALVRDLDAVGVARADVTLQSVSAEVSTGLLGRSSSAAYRLRVRCRGLDALPDVLGAVTAQKTASLGEIVWGYGDTADVRARLVDECVERAKARAARVAAGLGVRLLGVHAYAEEVTDSEGPVAYPHKVAGARGGMGVQARLTAEDLGMQVTHSKTVTVCVDIQFKISEFE